MMKVRDSIFKKLDWLTVILVLVLMFLGVVSICGASFGYEDANIFSFDSRPGKQVLWCCVSLFAASVVMFFKENYLRTYAYIFYIVFITLLLVTILVASETKGSHSWLKLGPVSFQPAEFAKLATILALAKYVETPGFNADNKNMLFKAVGIVFLPMVLIVAQNETGSALVYLALFFVLHREGMSGMVLLAGFCAILFFILGIKYQDVPFGDQPFNIGPFVVLAIIQIFIVLLTWIFVQDQRVTRITAYLALGTIIGGIVVSLNVIPFKVPVLQLASICATVVFLTYNSFKNMLRPALFISLFAVASVIYLYSCNFVYDHMKPHQQVRISVILGMKDDPYGAGYNVNQSMIAIGSGGLTGKGFGNGTQTKLKYVPEQYTDFIFCTIGEEQGFVGSIVVLCLLASLILRLIWLSERQTTQFARTTGYSVASILFMHLFVNIGMVLGITPVIGIPLPFFSYGGSSLLSFTIMISVFLRMDSERTVRFQGVG